MHCVGSRRPLADANPLRSVPFMRARAEVFGPKPLRAARIKLAQLRSGASLIESMTYYCKNVLAAANRMPTFTCRRWQANAMKGINQAGADLRGTLKNIARRSCAAGPGALRRLCDLARPIPAAQTLPPSLGFSLPQGAGRRLASAADRLRAEAERRRFTAPCRTASGDTEEEDDRADLRRRSVSPS